MNAKYWLLFFKLTGSVIIFFTLSCAHNLSMTKNSMPGGVKKINIPLFKNESREPGIEIYFTNSLKTEAIKAHLSLQDEENNSEAVFYGTITSMDVIVVDESIMEASKNSSFLLPSETVLAATYTVKATINLVLKKRGSSEVLWSGSFTQARNYSAPIITLPVTNTANPLYNLSAKRQTLDILSREMMQEAFDRLLENF